MSLDDVPPTEELEDYRATARQWLAAQHAPAGTAGSEPDQGPERLRQLMAILWDGGYAGICFPTELGGAGLSRFHHQAFLEEALPYELPIHIGNPGLSIIAPPIMEFGTEEQKRHVTAMLRGDEIFVQMMSEPSGGSDMAGALSRADRDGDVWILNGSKIWSSGAYRSDWGLVLVRTDWSVPKHRGLSMVLLDLSLPGVTVNKIRMVNGAEEFCQEYFTDVGADRRRHPGRAQRRLDGGHPPAGPRAGRRGRQLALRLQPAGVGARRRQPGPGPTGRPLGTGDRPDVRELVGEAHADEIVSRQLIDRVTEAISLGRYPPIAGSLLRLNTGVQRRAAGPPSPSRSPGPTG